MTDLVAVFVLLLFMLVLYESLFAENSVAAQKQYSTSIDTNKIQNTTIKSITSSFFTKLYYYVFCVAAVSRRMKIFIIIYTAPKSINRTHTQTDSSGDGTAPGGEV